MRQALSSHPDVEIVGTAVEPAKAQEKLAASGAQVVLHGSSRGDRLPTADVEAIRQATAAPIMLVTSGNASGLLQEALAAGVADVVLLPQLTDALVFTIRKTTQLVHASAPRRRSPALRPTTDGKIITVFSPKGGVGKTRRSPAALATQLARKCERRALLLDLDLQFGDAAIMMGDRAREDDLRPRHDDGRARHREARRLRHDAPVGRRPRARAGAPRGRRARVAEERVARLLDVAKESYDAIVVDTPAFFQATTLATLDRTDASCWCARSTSPRSRTSSSRCRRSTCCTTPRTASTSCSTARGGKGELKRGEVEKALDLKVSFELPNDREVGVAVNRGVPVPLSSPRCGVSKALATWRASSSARRQRGPPRAGAVAERARTAGRQAPQP